MLEDGYTLKKEERLHGKNDISALLSKGRFGEIPGIKYCVRRNTGSGKNRIMISVPKRLFKRAVKRNLLKRRIRESYRLQKKILPETGGTDILFMYTNKELLPFTSIYDIIGHILRNISGEGQK